MSYNETPIERYILMNLNFTKKTDDLDNAIHQALVQLQGVGTDNPEYANMVEQVAKLYKLKENNSKRRVSADTLAIVIGNLAGIVLILGYERAHVVTSKALGFVMKPR